MAHLLHTEKLGSHWTLINLKVYNIIVKVQNAATFFGVKTLPWPAVACKVLKKFAADKMASNTNYKLIHYMDFAMCGKETAVVMFVKCWPDLGNDEGHM